MIKHQQHDVSISKSVWNENMELSELKLIVVSLDLCEKSTEMITAISFRRDIPSLVIYYILVSIAYR